MDVAETNYMFLKDNSKVIVPDTKLQECLNSWFIFTDEIYTLCLPHITIASDEHSFLLTHKAISENLHLETPIDLIYKDPSSLFWLHPDLNWSMNSEKIIWSWKELCNRFLDFCTSNTNHFTRVGLFFFVKKSSPLASILKFEYFHEEQIETILKKLTKFLGKHKNLENCSQLKFSCSNKFIFRFIELYINNYNQLLPEHNLYIDI